MLTRTVLLATLFSASAVVATNLHGHLEIKRAIEARQTSRGGGDDDDDSAGPSFTGSIPVTACVADAISLMSSFPTPPPALADEITRVTVTDVCAYTPPASLAAPYSSYDSAVRSWYSVNRDRVSSLKNCPGFDTIPDRLDDLDDICSTTPAGGNSASPTTGGANVQTTGLGGGAESGTGSGTGAGSASTRSTGGSGAGALATSSSSTAAGPRETGFAGAALAAAGFFGVVAAL